MKESIDKYIKCINEYDVKDAFGFIKKEGKLYLIDEYLNEIEI